MNLKRLHRIISETTLQLRKGDVVRKEDRGPIRKVICDMMPHQDGAPADLEKIDCHFLVVGVDRVKAEQRRAELVSILHTYPDIDRLKAGPSYIEVGAAIGDQGAAFQLFALGQVLGLWKVIVPKDMGFDGPLADEMAGRGFVLISGFHPEQAAA